MAEPDDTGASEAAPPRKSKKKLFVVLGTLLVLLGGGGAGAWYFMAGSAPKEAHEQPVKNPIFLPLDTFTVNLQDGEQYLQLDITLQFAEQAQLDLIKLHMPRVRSRLLSLLSSKHGDELITPDDKQKLIQEILAQVREPLVPKGKPQQVDDALFTSFVIQ